MPPERGAQTDPEVLARATRRQFTAQYKADIVRRADACQKLGEVGELLRREGLYSSHLTMWRKHLRQRGVAGLKKKRGPASKAKPSAREIELERKTKKLEKQLAKAQAIIEFQKKAHEILGIPLKNHGLDGDD
jgi:transposase-like protein